MLVSIVLWPLWVRYYLDDKERAGCFAFIVFWMFCCYCSCSVACHLDDVGWSAVCDFGIS